MQRDHRDDLIEVIRGLLYDFGDDLYDDFQQKDIYTSSECLEIVHNRLKEYNNNLNEVS